MKGENGMHQRKPDWLKIRTKGGKNKAQVENILGKLSLNTVCKEANCPNLTECFNRKTATFMILGSVCTRNCIFCNVEKGYPQLVDTQEPTHVAQAVGELDLRHVVITSVTRDDLPDGGAGHFARVVEEIRKANKGVVIEVLIPDFKGELNALLKVVQACPEIINHNIETVPRLYSSVRPMALYERSLELLSRVKESNGGIMTKSGIMLGLGEQKEEVLEVFNDLRRVDCDILIVGQYLAPSAAHYEVKEYVHPDTFEEYKELALELGFKNVASGPLVRSSYLAEKLWKEN